MQLKDYISKINKKNSKVYFSGISFMDFAAPIDRPIMKRFIARHRLLKKDHDAENSWLTLSNHDFHLDRVLVTKHFSWYRNTKNNAKQRPGKTSVTTGVKIEGKKDAVIFLLLLILT